MRIPLAQALAQLKDELREAILDTRKDIVFAPKDIELELNVGFDVEAKASGGVKLLSFLHVSAEAGEKSSNHHKLTLKLDVTDSTGKKLLIRDTNVPEV